MPVVQNRIAKSLLIAVGVLSVVFGVIGLFLPIVPTTPFILVAAWCFVRSSKRAHEWLHRQPVFGKALTDWEQHRAISRPAKITAIATLTGSAALMWIQVDNIWLKSSVSLILVTVGVFIATRNESRYSK